MLAFVFPLLRYQTPLLGWFFLGKSDHRRWRSFTSPCSSSLRWSSSRLGRRSTPTAWCHDAKAWQTVILVILVILECQSLANFQKSVICSFQPHTMIPGNSGPRTAAIPAMSFSGWLQLGPQHSPEEPSNKSCQKGLKRWSQGNYITNVVTLMYISGHVCWLPAGCILIFIGHLPIAGGSPTCTGSPRSTAACGTWRSCWPKSCQRGRRGRPESAALLGWDHGTVLAGTKPSSDLFLRFSRVSDEVIE